MTLSYDPLQIMLIKKNWIKQVTMLTEKPPTLDFSIEAHHYTEVDNSVFKEDAHDGTHKSYLV